MTMRMNDKDLDRLLAWLAGYVLILIVIGWTADKLVEVLPVITNLVSAFSGAAFAIMRSHKGNDHE